MEDVLTFSFHQGTVPLTIPPVHLRVSDFIFNTSLIVPYSRVLAIRNIAQFGHKYSQKYICYGLDLVSDVSG